MKVFVLSLLAVSSVSSHAIHYPGYHQLLAFEPSRGQFPVYNEFNQGFLNYHDHNGQGRTVRYNYPEPLFGLRRYIYSADTGSNKFLRTSNIENGFNAQSYYQPIESNILEKAREDHFRKWCATRYQALKDEIEKQKTEGIRPSSDILAQLQPLEKIVTTATYNDITWTPEIKRIHDEHLRIWNEARLKVLQQESEHLRFYGNKQTTSGTKVSGEIIPSSPFVNAEQKKTHDEHLFSTKLIANQVDMKKIDSKESQPKLELQQNVDLKSTLDSKLMLQQADQQNQQQILQQQLPQIDDTPEVKRARDEHLRAVNEAILRAKAEGSYNANDDGSYKASKYEENIQKSPENIQPGPLLKFIPAVQQPIQPIQNIAIPQISQPTQQAFQQSQSSILKATITGSLEQQQPQQPLPVQDTPEVIRAREEHLRLFNEAKLKTQQLSDSFEDSKNMQSLPTLATTSDIREDQREIEAERQREAELELQRNLEEEKLRKEELLREQQRQEEEKRLREAEELRLKQEEEQRLREAEEFRLKKEEEKRIRETEELRLKQEEEKRRLEKEDLTKSLEYQTQNQNQLQITSSSSSGLFTFPSSTGSSDLSSQIEYKPTISKTSLNSAAEIELQRKLEEENLRKEELFREQQRQEEEKRLREAEKLQLKLEEEKRRLEKEQQQQQQQISSSSSASYGGISTSFTGGPGLSSQIKFTPTLSKTSLHSSADQSAEGANFLSSSFNGGSGTVSGSGFVLSSQYKSNPFLVRFAAQPGTTAYIINEPGTGLPQLTTPSLNYLPTNLPIVKQNLPLLAESGLTTEGAKQATDLATNAFLSSGKISTSTASSSQSYSSSSSSSNLSQSSNIEAKNLSELEKATREHFRAHEIALEQLRLANARNPHQKDC